MEITKKCYGSTLVIMPKGRLDTNTSPELQKEVEDMPESVDELIFDFCDLNYISSAGLRVLLSAQKKINTKNGKLKIINIKQIISEIFEVTGFDSFLNIKK